MAKKKIRKSDKMRDILGNEAEPIFQELWVNLEYGWGEEFVLPRGIINYYSLENGDAFHCELLKLRGKRYKEYEPHKSLPEELEIGKDVLVDIVGLPEDLHGKIPSATFELYDMENYEFALFKIKKVIRKR